MRMVLTKRFAWRLPGYALLGALPPTYAWYVNSTGDVWLEGAWRGLYFWGRVGPIVLQYLWTNYSTRRGVSSDERSAAFDKLHATHAPTALSVILSLRGFYVKVGQFASSRADIVPQAYLEQFRTLQDSVPHEDIAQVRAIITETLGKSSQDVFTHIEPEPLGAASIGQAHLARLYDGSEVVVKVQYPSVRRTFHLDMSCIRAVVGLLEPSLSPILDELKKQFLTEFDYRGEARNLDDVAQLIMPKWGGCVAMPKPLWDFCGEHALTMTYLPGEKLETALRQDWERAGFSAEDLQIKFGNVAPPSPRRIAIFLRLFRCYNGLMDLLATVSNPIRRLITGVQPTDRSSRIRIPDRQRLVRTLLGVHAQQVLEDGVFNADLHPGNFLLLPDGRLGLIDFGQVKRIDSSTRRQLARLLVSVADGDRHATVVALTELGVRSTKMDPYFLETNARLFFGGLDGDLTGGRPLGDFVMDLRSKDTLVNMPGELYLPCRAAMMLRGLALLLHCPVSIAKEWRPVAERVLAESVAH
eukprot:TRINITY_DN45651_c0_g1_i1.p1 TRINITY_DN45651_c0_g1~~TRINITY_DN45651_c0_g1_i1.p1  ORF type:complete len:527 (+),score=65.20 TRINITY_DN45651_c0_g1_i1:79-1659(+)